MKLRRLNFLSLTFALLFTTGFTNQAKSDELFENSSGSPVLSLFQNAQTSIRLEIYTMNDSRIRAELKNAIDRGVKVEIIQEPTAVGASCKIFNAPTANDSALCGEEKSLVSYIQSHGGQYVPFPKTLCGSSNHCVEHGKMAIVDNQTATISTGNLDSSSLCDLTDHPSTCDRDFTVSVTDASVIQDLTTVFENDLRGATTDFKSLSARLTVSPESMGPITNFIASANTSLVIENQYLKDATMNQAIVDAAGRGVAVTVIVSSACAFGKPKGSELTKWNSTYSAFDAAGIHTRIFTSKIRVGGQKGYLHAKTMIADGTRAWVGSVNGSTAALSNNREYGIFSNDSAFVSKLSQSISADVANSAGESWQDSANCANDY